MATTSKPLVADRVQVPHDFAHGVVLAELRLGIEAPPTPRSTLVVGATQPREETELPDQGMARALHQCAILFRGRVPIELTP
jgi:hypothetical protein